MGDIVEVKMYLEMSDKKSADDMKRAEHHAEILLDLESHPEIKSVFDVKVTNVDPRAVFNPMTEDEFIFDQLIEHPDADKAILSFIWKLTCAKDADTTKSLVEQYATKQCYFFAMILKDMLGGSVLWIFKEERFVYKYKGIYYDSYGVLAPPESKLLPLSSLPDAHRLVLMGLVSPDIEVVAHGECSNNIIWVLYNNGVLCLCGMGILPNAYIQTTNIPWEPYIKDVRFVDIAADIQVPDRVLYNLSLYYRRAKESMDKIIESIVRMWNPSVKIPSDGSSGFVFSFTSIPGDDERFVELIIRYNLGYKKEDRQGNDSLFSYINIAYHSMLCTIGYTTYDIIDAKYSENDACHVRDEINFRIEHYNKSHTIPAIAEFIYELLNNRGRIPCYSKSRINTKCEEIRRQIAREK
ncbi:MAG: hypothetical protein NC548_37715 [Lachnospiraceae bacterium]|nr:hypothetical protein [Lachnospiraceae bacterium]